MMMMVLRILQIFSLLLQLVSCMLLFSTFESMIPEVVAIKRKIANSLSSRKFVISSSVLSNNFLRIQRGGDSSSVSSSSRRRRIIDHDDSNDGTVHDDAKNEENPIDRRKNMSTNNSTTGSSSKSTSTTKKKDDDGSKDILSKTLVQNKKKKSKLVLLSIVCKNIQQTIQLSKSSIGYKLLRPIRTQLVLLCILLLYRNQLLLLLLQFISEPIYDTSNKQLPAVIIIGRSISLKSLLKATILIDLLRRCTVILFNIFVIYFYKYQNQQQQQKDDCIVDVDSVDSLSSSITNTTKTQSTTSTTTDNTTTTTTTTTNLTDIVKNQSTTTANTPSLLYTFLTKSPIVSLLLIFLLGMVTSTSDGESNSSINIVVHTISIILRTIIQTISSTSTSLSSSGILSILLFIIRLYGSSSIVRNPVYIPSIEQHYTFEQINERYIKDDYAYQKVISTSTTINNVANSNMPEELLNTNQSSQGNNTLLTTTSTNSSVETILSRKYIPLSQSILQKMLHLFNIQQQSSSSPLSSSVGFVPTQVKDISSYNGTVVIMDWTDLDTSVSTQEMLRDKVSFIIHQYNKYYKQSSSGNYNNNKEFEVVVLLESSGGSVADYALASSHLLRLRNVGIVVTVCVDKVAASGGYMIACTASPNQLYGSTFAIFGSIGVIGQTINIQNLLNKYGIKSIIIKGGKNKAPLGMFGDVTNDNIQNVQSMINTIHSEFKNYIVLHRPILLSTIEDISTGDIWLGCNAIHNKLIDRLITSDEYITERIYTDNARVVKLVQIIQSKYPSIFSKPLTVQSSSLISSSTTSLLSSQQYNQQQQQQQYTNNLQMLPMALSQHEQQSNPLVPSYYFMKSYFGTILSDIRSLIVQRFL